MSDEQLRETRRIVSNMTTQEQAEALKVIDSYVLVQEVLNRLLTAEEQLQAFDDIRRGLK